MTRRLWPWLALLALLGTACVAYQPGMSGGFLFDDFANLDALGATGPINNWPAFWRYVTSGTADPTGRPLALLSFLIDARDWPADPANFLRTNLLLHLSNSVLLFALLRQLGRVLSPDERECDAAALLSAGLWLLHPLLVSTTLYVVQREAMLPTTFTLLGLLAYAHGRARFGQSEGRAGTGWMATGVGVGTALALLCKGNGILLPLLAWVLEATIFNRHSLSPVAARKLRTLAWPLLILPSLFLFGYLALNLRLLDTDLPTRPWTIGQRLLTEPRVLLDYLQLLVVPRSMSTGLYNDNYPVSLSLFSPATTLPALLLIIGLVSAGFLSRVRSPRLSAAILFYFAAQLLESSTIPLELYFEHRNYLPALLLFWPLSYQLCTWQARKSLRMAVAFGLLLLFAFTTFKRAELWGQPEKLATLWAKQNPASSRAQATAGIAQINAGQYDRAAAQLGPLWRQRPDDMQLAFNYINAVCQARGVSADEKQALTAALRQSASGELLIHQWLGQAIEVAVTARCPGLDLNDVDEWIAASSNNPQISPPGVRDQTIEPLRARIAIARQQPDLALVHFNQALSAFISPDFAARNAAFLASAGYYPQALAHLNYYESIEARKRKPGSGMPWLHSKVLDWQNYWPREMAILRKNLAIELEKEKPSQSPESP